MLKSRTERTEDVASVGLALLIVFLNGCAYGSGILVPFLILSKVNIVLARSSDLAYLAAIAASVQYCSCDAPGTFQRSSAQAAWLSMLIIRARPAANISAQIERHILMPEREVTMLRACSSA